MKKGLKFSRVIVLITFVTSLFTFTPLYMGYASTSPSLLPEAAGSSCSVVKSMELAADYWISHNPTPGPNDWLVAQYHQGNLALYKASKNSKYYQYSEDWGKAHQFKLQSDRNNTFFPDLQAVGSAYLDLYEFDHQPNELSDLRARLAAETVRVNQGKQSYWSYVDALNMSMPNFARLGVMDNNQADLATMQTLFHYTEQVAGGKGLYNPKTGLWWRDHNYVGSSVYWSRGNGWAFMALAKVLDVLPLNDPRRPEYVKVFQAMANSLKKSQRADGFWNVDLGNPNDFPGPESSGTAFFTYGIAWGINHGLLDAVTYTPVVTNSWHALSTKALNSKGFLGYVQGPGSRPADHQPLVYNSTSSYAVGGFLLAGAQMMPLTPNCVAK